MCRTTTYLLPRKETSEPPPPRPGASDLPRGWTVSATRDLSFTRPSTTLTTFEVFSHIGSGQRVDCERWAVGERGGVRGRGTTVSNPPCLWV